MLDSFEIIGIAILIGFFVGKLFTRYRIPSVAGYVLIGVIFGSSVLNIFDETLLNSVTVIPDLALGLIAFTIGIELKRSTLSKIGKSIFAIVVFEATLAFLLVSLSVYWFTKDIPLSLVLGSIASATAPAATVMVLNELKAKGITAVILDLDDTLLSRTSTDITPKLYSFVENLKELEFKICISSNNRFPSRVKFVARELSLPYTSLAFKPLPQAFEKALTMLESSKKETAIIGDQLFTDILGGNLFGIHTILVNFLTPETSPLRQLMRNAEKFCLKM